MINWLLNLPILISVASTGKIFKAEILFDLIVTLEVMKHSNFRYLNAREAFSFNNESLTKLLRHHFNPDVLTELDFNFCYWISSKDISSFARRCKNLEELSVVHSNLTIRDLIHILQEDTKITKLRLSINSQKEFWLTDHITMKKSVGMPSDQSSYGTAWKNLFLVCEFEKCRLTMSKLTSLDLQMGQDPIVLGTILR